MRGGHNPKYKGIKNEQSGKQDGLVFWLDLALKEILFWSFWYSVSNFVKALWILDWIGIPTGS